MNHEEFPVFLRLCGLSGLQLLSLIRTVTNLFTHTKALSSPDVCACKSLQYFWYKIHCTELMCEPWNKETLGTSIVLQFSINSN